MKPPLDTSIGFRTDTKTKNDCLKLNDEMKLGYNDLIKIALRFVQTNEGKEAVELDKLNKKIENLKKELEETIHEKELLELRISQRKQLEENIQINGKIQERFEEIKEEFVKYHKEHKGSIENQLDFFEDYRHSMFQNCCDEFHEFGGKISLVKKHFKKWILKQKDEI